MPALARLGRAITLLYGALVLAGGLGTLASTQPTQWPVLLPYFVLEFSTLAVVLFAPRPVAWADSAADVVVPVVTTFFYTAVVWLVRPVAAPGPLLEAGRVVLVASYAWCAWAILHLRSNFSILPEARALVTTGPYAWVRHPLYLGYLGTILAGALIDRSLLLVGAGVVWAFLFHWRAGLEEAKLGSVFVGYGAYRDRTGRLFVRLRAARDGPSGVGPAA